MFKIITYVLINVFYLKVLINLFITLIKFYLKINNELIFTSFFAILI